MYFLDIYYGNTMVFFEILCKCLAKSRVYRGTLLISGDNAMAF